MDSGLQFTVLNDCIEIIIYLKSFSNYINFVLTDNMGRNIYIGKENIFYIRLKF